MPAAADGLLFRVAPYLSFCAAFVPFLALPFAPGWVVQPLDTAAFFILAVGGLEVFGVILGGYASGSKWSLYGAMREAAQVVSYEIPLGMCVVVPVLMAGTMDLTEIAKQQAGWFTIGTSSIRSPSSPSSSIWSAPRPARIAPRSTCPRPRANWWPAS